MVSMKKYHIVYRTRHIPTGRYYIGVHSTNNLNDRYRGSGKAFMNIYRAHPKSEFDFKIIAELSTRGEAEDLEGMIVQDWMIDKTVMPLLMNLAPGGGSSAIGEANKGYKHTAEAKAAISRNNTRDYTDPVFLERARAAAIARSAQTSKQLTGRTFSAEHRANLSKARRRTIAQKAMPQ